MYPPMLGVEIVQWRSDAKADAEQRILDLMREGYRTTGAAGTTPPDADGVWSAWVLMVADTRNKEMR